MRRWRKHKISIVINCALLSAAVLPPKATETEHIAQVDGRTGAKIAELLKQLPKSIHPGLNPSVLHWRVTSFYFSYTTLPNTITIILGQGTAQKCPSSRPKSAAGKNHGLAYGQGMTMTKTISLLVRLHILPRDHTKNSNFSVRGRQGWRRSNGRIKDHQR